MLQMISTYDDRYKRDEVSSPPGGGEQNATHVETLNCCFIVDFVSTS